MVDADCLELDDMDHKIIIIFWISACVVAIILFVVYCVPAFSTRRTGGRLRAGEQTPGVVAEIAATLGVAGLLVRA